MADKPPKIKISKRDVERLPLQAMVTYQLDGQEYGNLAADVSEDGIFIRTFLPPRVGTHLVLSMQLPRELGGYRVELEGRVARVVEGEDPRQNGMGVMFTGVHATELQAVRYLVSRIFRFDVLKRSRRPSETDPMDEEDTDPGPP